MPQQKIIIYRIDTLSTLFAVQTRSFPDKMPSLLTKIQSRIQHTAHPGRTLGNFLATTTLVKLSRHFPTYLYTYTCLSHFLRRVSHHTRSIVILSLMSIGRASENPRIRKLSALANLVRFK